MKPTEHPLWPAFVEWWKQTIGHGSVGPPIDTPDEWRLEWNAFAAGHNGASQTISGTKKFVTNPADNQDPSTGTGLG